MSPLQTRLEKKPKVFFTEKTFGILWAIDEFCKLWLPWATHRKVRHKMAVWMATQRGWLSKRPFCAILFYASPWVIKACKTRLCQHTGRKGSLSLFVFLLMQLSDGCVNYKTYIHFFWGGGRRGSNIQGWVALWRQANYDHEKCLDLCITHFTKTRTPSLYV